MVIYSPVCGPILASDMFIFFLRIKDSTTDPTDMSMPVRNIRSNAVADGWVVVIVVIVVVVVLNVCIKNPAMIGPTDIPIIIITTLKPRDIPLYWIGVEVSIILNTPVLSNA